MTIIVKRKDSGEIIQIPAYAVAFDGDCFGVWQSKEDLYDVEMFDPEYWQILEVCDE